MQAQQGQDRKGANDQPLTYEDAYRRLEDLVEQLSAGGLSLEDSLRYFEQGVALANYCSNLLDSAELRVQQVNNLPPEELAALLDRPATPLAGGFEQAPAAASAPVRRDEPQPGRGQAGPAAPNGGRAANGRRVPPTTGSQRRTRSEELDPLFDEF